MSNILIQDIHITQSTNYNLYAENVNSFSVIGCQITNAGENGVLINGSGNNILFTNSIINKCNNNGFQIDQYNSFVFRNNKLSDIATSPGRGKSGDAQYLGFIAYTLNSTNIEYNTIDSIGYNALTFPQNNAIVYRNRISNFCLVKSDGGGLYNWNGVKNNMTNVVLQENIIYNGIGAPEGSSDGFRGANGIYLDECISNVIVRNNTVFNCFGLGIYLHDTQNVLSEGNTIFDCFEAQYSVDNTGICTASNNISRNNIAVAKLPSQLTAKYESYTSSLATLGNFDNNVYARPVDDVLTMRLSYPPPNGNLYDLQPLQEWQTKYGKDINSKKSPFTIKDYSTNNFNGPEKIIDGNFNNNNGGFFVFSDFNNGQGTWDNTNKINGGSLALTFSTISGGLAASLYAAKTIGSVSKDKDYVVSFDAITTVPNRIILVYIQYQFPPFNRLVELYPGKIVSTSTQRYEARFRPITDLENALLVFRVFESNQPLWIDNVSFKEASLNKLDPNSLTKIIYNPTTRDSTVTVNGNYKDVNNQLYPQTVVLGPFKSLILIKDITLPTTDLSLLLTSNKRLVQTSEPITFTLNVANTSSIPVTSGQWELRMPANMELVSYPNISYTNNILTGNITNLSGNSQQLFQFTAKPIVNGIYRLSAQIISSNIPDNDSNVNSGTADGEDDTSTTEVLTRNISYQLYESPNTNQLPLPTPLSSGNTISLTQADLSIIVKVDKRVARVSNILTYSVIVQNAGGYTANNIQIESNLPNGLQFVLSEGWTLNGSAIRASITSLAANASKILTFQLRATQAGKYINMTQITSASPSDPDSTPNNGFRGEDDESNIDIIVQP
ncbi:hypothetical protein BLX24_24710 [Arsenicibacter rosenii]|uniref:DUF11 domain-containing protein n=2 Tax=Arsenicibacter rosenii TaxID=1750698 RepID=A0A1S2VCR0_9BACT|nr:hypothetical protein BLX24_24710 [Arsenicibacter rosenii]